VIAPIVKLPLELVLVLPAPVAVVPLTVRAPPVGLVVSGVTVKVLVVVRLVLL
jgi:hypothetical protein